jgi:hypothetical protein
MKKAFICKDNEPCLNMSAAALSRHELHADDTSDFAGSLDHLLSTLKEN